MKRLSLIFCGLILTVLPCTSAFADSLFDYSFSGPIVSGTGEFTATEVTPGTFELTGITGTVNGISMDAFLPASLFVDNDYLLNYPGTSDGSTKGDPAFTFDLLDGGKASVLYGEDGYLLRICDPLADQTTPLTITEVSSSPVPEPGSLALMGAGALGLAGVVRRRLSV